MAILTAVQDMLEPGEPYSSRKACVQFVTYLYVNACNTYLSPDDVVQHRGLRGFIESPRSDVFDASALGLRGLLAMSTSELNERCWDFFRYAIVELVHSQKGGDEVRRALHGVDDESPAGRYRTALPTILAGVQSNRKTYIDDAINAALNSREFKTRLDMAGAEARGEGKSEAEIERLKDKLREERQQEISQVTQRHLIASLGAIESSDEMLQRLLAG
jgi:hypothetical protein